MFRVPEWRICLTATLAALLVVGAGLRVAEPDEGSGAPAFSSHCRGFLQSPRTRLVAVLGDYRFLHAGAVYAVAFHPDGKHVLSSGDDRVVRLWEASTGREVRVFEGHDGTVGSLALGAEPVRLLTGSDDRTLRLWDLADGSLLGTLRGHDGAVNAVWLDGKGGWAMSGGGLFDSSVRRWNLEESAETWKAEKHSFGVKKVVVSPDGTRVWSVARDGKLIAWDAATGEPGWSAEGIDSMACSPDGAWLLTGCVGEVRVYDAKTGDLVRRIDGHTGSVSSLCWTPDGKQALTVSDEVTLQRIDPHAGKVLAVLSERSRLEFLLTAMFAPFAFAGTDYTSVAVSPDGTRAVSGGGQWHRHVMLWDLVAGRSVPAPATGHAGAVSAVAFTPDGTRAVTASWDGTARVWDVASAKERARLELGSGDATAVAIPADGAVVAVGTELGSVALFDLESRALAWKRDDVPGAVAALRFDPDSQRLHSAHRQPDGLICRSWERRSGAPGRAVVLPGAAATAAMYADGDRMLCGRSDGSLVLWDLEKDARVHELRAGDPPVPEGETPPPSRAVTAVAVLPGGAAALSGDERGVLERWDLATGKLLGALDPHGSPVTAIAISPDGALALTGEQQGVIRLWDLALGKRLDAIDLATSGDAVMSLAFAPDGRSFLVGTGGRVGLRFRLREPE